MQGFKLNAAGYFQDRGVDIMAFDDIYPEGHQSGVSIIMHGRRIATCGDVRFEPTPGQWQPVPKQIKRELGGDSITATLEFPDRARHLNGFNPMIYPDFEFGYTVTVKAEGASVIIRVDLDKPVPDKFAGKLSFNLELFPGALFGKPWIMDGASGIFPEQPNGPVLSQPPNCAHTGDFSLPGAKADAKRLSGDNTGYNPIIADDFIAEPYASGARVTICPDDKYTRFTVESLGAPLKLYDGRMNHNNGWFALSSAIAAGESALTWRVTPNVVEDWLYAPVIQASQVGYHPDQPKVAVIELDRRDASRAVSELYKIGENGEELALTAGACEWGQFLRYSYAKFDFTEVRDEGLYKIKYGGSESQVFRIARDIYDRGVWQPVLEYFLPVQMCHMRVSEKYRVWHGLCHDDDAQMAPVGLNHIDGYVQGDSTLCKYKPGESIPGLNAGGWHDAGDFDLRVESQAGEFYILALAYEAFEPLAVYDATAIDQQARVCEIHQPDGKPDILQQIEHGVLSVAGAYRALGRLYRGIIERDLRQYVHLGDSASMGGECRWVFTEDNPPRELTAAAQLAAAGRALRGFNAELSAQALEIARELYSITRVENPRAKSAKIHAAAELLLATGDRGYREHLLAEREFIAGSIDRMGWFIARAEQAMADAQFTQAIRGALSGLKERLAGQSSETPYGIPYRPHIWGAGWNIQRLGFEYYYLHRAYPDIFGPELIFDALNFILGCHPGSNNMSFASGVGVNSATVGYGLNRADWSYIPGGVISGTALIRPDFPELLIFPYLWQQVEYVMGGGSSHYMFLALAAQQILGDK